MSSYNDKFGIEITCVFDWREILAHKWINCQCYVFYSIFKSFKNLYVLLVLRTIM